MLAHGHGSNVFVKAHLVNLFAKKGGDSGAVYARNISEKNVVSRNSLLKAYLKCGDIDEALKFFMRSRRL